MSVALPELLRVPTVARMLNISPAQAWRLVWSGDIPSVRLSEKVVRVPADQLEAWLESKKGLTARSA